MKTMLVHTYSVKAQGTLNLRDGSSIDFTFERDVVIGDNVDDRYLAGAIESEVIVWAYTQLGNKQGKSHKLHNVRYEYVTSE